MRFLDAREWLEWVYANGRGDPADFAATLLDELDFSDWDDAATQLIKNLAHRMDLVEPADTSKIDRFEEDIMTINNRYRAIVRTLEELGVVQDEATADIPALLRLLIAPA